MIIQFLITSLLWLLTAIFGLFTLPAAPLVMMQAINGVIGFFAIPIGLFRNYLGDTFFVAIMAILVLYLFFNPIWHITVWIYQRIRG